MSTSRSLWRDLTVTPFSIALTALLEPVHRGSLANARQAISGRRADDLATAMAPGQIRRGGEHQSDVASAKIGA